MDVNEIIEQIDEQIARLQFAKSALTAEVSENMVKRKPGRPRMAEGKVFAAPAKRIMSSSARKKIAAAQEKRWAAFHAARATKK